MPEAKPSTTKQQTNGKNSLVVSGRLSLADEAQLVRMAEANGLTRSGMVSKILRDRLQGRTTAAPAGGLIKKKAKRPFDFNYWPQSRRKQWLEEHGESE